MTPPYAIEKRITQPYEDRLLHYLANWWNWDDGKTEEVMKQILAHPLCDRGTALLLYWRSQTPEIEADVSRIPLYQQPDFELAALIEARLQENQFASEVISYDPKEDADLPEKFKREVPFEWLQPSAGIRPDFGR